MKDDRKPPVAGLFEAEQADAASARLEREGMATVEVDGGSAAEGMLGRRVGRSALIGALVALPIGILVAIVAWLRVSAGVSIVIPLVFVTPTIVFVGAFVGIMVAVARSEWLVRRNTLVIVRQPLGEQQREHAERILTDLGGEPSKPVVERGDSPQPGGRPAVSS